MANPPTKRVYALHKRKKKSTTPKRLRTNHGETTGDVTTESVEIKKGRWSPDEDAKLLSLVRVQQRENGIDHEISWDQVEQAFQTRSKKQCRERWLSQLDPTLNKKEWTKAEDQVLLRLSSELNKRWAEIARKIPGRTENMVKNRWHALQRQSNGVTPKRKRSSKSSSTGVRKQRVVELNKQVVYPLVAVTSEKIKVNSPAKVVDTRKKPSVSGDASAVSNSNEVFLFTKSRNGAAEPLARIASFETRRNHLMLDRQNSLEMRGHPFGDKPDVLQRNPSFDLHKENSVDTSLGNNSFWNQQMQRNNSLALLEKQLSLTDIPKAGTPIPFIGGSELVKQHSLDLGQIGKRQVSYGVRSLNESTIEQIFLDEQPVDVGEFMML